jgi:integrase
LKCKTLTRIIRTTGLRIGLVCRIKKEDVKITEDERVFLNTKCKVPRSAQIQRITIELLNTQAKKVFLTYLEQRNVLGLAYEDYIFSDSTPRAAAKNYRDGLKTVCRKAGLPYISPHGAKHGFITEMAENGFTAEQICALTGNKTPQLIQKVYMHLSTDKVREKARAILNNEDR